VLARLVVLHDPARAEGIDVDAVDLPRQRQTVAEIEVMRKKGLTISPDTLRLAYSFVSVDEIAEGVSRLAAALAVPV